VPLLKIHRLPLTGNRRDVRWLSGRKKTPTFRVFPVFSVAVMEKGCDACDDREYYLRSCCSASKKALSSEASNTVDRKSMGHPVAERSWKDADYLRISCIERGGYGKVL
jgi:hypothetical protein